MSEIIGKTLRPTPHASDPRVVRSRAAAMEAARTLFLRQGYAGTTMEEIAEAAGLTKRTLYNVYGSKDALFTEIVADVMTYADKFIVEMREAFGDGIPVEKSGLVLADLGRRLALAIVRSEVIALRRLLIGEARTFPDLAREYFERVPSRVIEALASRLEHLDQLGLLRVADPRRAAAQFAYLVAGEPLDRAMIVGTIPPREEIIACAQAGVETFLARYGQS